MSGFRARLTALVSLALLVPVAPVVTGATPAQADPPATLEVYGAGLTSPIQVNPTSADDPEPIRFSVAASSPVEDVTITASGPGLTVKVPAAGIGAASREQSATGTLLVSADTNGLHTLSLTASAPGATPVTRRIPYVWRSGGSPLPGGDSLAGRAYAANGFHDPDGSGRSRRFSSVITFVDATHATYGLPGHLTTACSGTSAARCVPYTWDRSTGLVQVGDATIGRLRETSTPYFDGATPASPQATGEFFDGSEFLRLRFPVAGHRYAGTWDYRSPYAQGVYAQHLTLRKDGTYAVSVRAGTPGLSGPSQTVRRDWSGRYRIGSGGRLTLRDARSEKTFTVARLAIGSAPGGQAQPARLGIELQVSVHLDRGADAGTTLVDGNLLSPRR